MPIQKNAKIMGMTSGEYHSAKGVYSSTQLKDILEDEEYFYKKHILKSIEREEIDAFSTGTYFHTAVLEPEKIADEIAIYPGKVKRGKEWEEFQKKNTKKTILTEAQIEVAKGLVESVKNSPVTMSYIKKGEPEVSMFVDLGVYSGEIYALDQGLKLGKEGWEKAKIGEKVKTKSTLVPVKVRADCLGEDFILDLKSTTGNAKSAREMQDKISYYQYDMSASFYLDIFSAGLEKKMETWIWTFASKDKWNCKSFKASQDNILVGRAKWSKAILTLAYCLENNWEFYDSLGVLEPKYYELEILKNKETSF